MRLIIVQHIYIYRESFERNDEGYGATKREEEYMCHMIYRNHIIGYLSYCIVLRK